jgi:hypothetical protein
VIHHRYFTVWLKDYAAQYSVLRASRPRNIARTSSSGFRHTDPDAVDIAFCRDLALSFSRAKRTFFHTNSPLELSLSSETSTPFLFGVPPCPHPAPEAFHDVQNEVKVMLRASLQRFIAARAGNTGTRRVLCGLTAGLVFMSFGFAPIFGSVFGHHSRLLRLAALPCLWAGATIFISALRGVSRPSQHTCAHVYVFPLDLRWGLSVWRCSPAVLLRARKTP